MAETVPAPNRIAAEWADRAASYASYAVPKNRPFARRLVRLMGPTAGERVIDIATGPGVVAIEVAAAMGDGGSVLATDLSPEWQPFVVGAAREAGVTGVTFQAMPAEALAPADASFDAAFCQFGLMFVPNPVLALQEMQRVLRPGGRLGIAVWSTPDRVGHFVAQRALMAALPPPDAPLGPSPTSLGEPGLIESLVAGAGFVEVAAERFTSAHEIVSPDHEWSRLASERRFADQLERLDAARVQEIRRTVVAALEERRTDGVIRLESEAILVTGRRTAQA
jgi:SAM-dependent methyltransferase